VDWLAFVALDQRKIAYRPMEACRTADGKIKICFDLKSTSFAYRQRVYANGTVRRLYGLFMEDYARFDPPADAPVS
jgi:hypothetical protein